MSMAALFLFFLGLAITSEAYYICLNTTTFTPNSTYQSNLNILLSSLAHNSTSKNGFHNTNIGQNPDTVYGLFLCRGDLSTDDCQDCVTFAAQEVVLKCPVEKVSVIWYDECLLRYSNQFFFNNVSSTSVMLFHTNNTFPTSYEDPVRATMNYLASRTSKSADKFGIGSTSFPGTTLYTLAQCTQDLSESNCQTCLQLATARLPNGPVGPRSMMPSCIIRYETYLFYNQSDGRALLLPPIPPLSPSPSPLYSPPPLYLPPPAGRKGKILKPLLKFSELV